LGKKFFHNFILLLFLLSANLNAGSAQTLNKEPSLASLGPLPAAETLSSGRLNRIEEQALGQTLRVVLKTNRSVSYKNFALKNPDRLVVDLSPCTLDLLSPPSVMDPLFEGFRFAQFNKNTVRVVFVAPKPLSCKISEQAGEPFQLFLDFPKKAGSSQPAAPEKNLKDRPHPLTLQESAKDLNTGPKPLDIKPALATQPLNKPQPIQLAQASQIPTVPAPPGTSNNNNQTPVKPPVPEASQGVQVQPSISPPTPAAEQGPPPLNDLKIQPAVPGTSSGVIAQPSPEVRPGPQPQPGIQPPIQPSAQPAIPGRPLPGKQPQAKRGEVSFNFDDADVFSVVQTIFGGVLKVNYIIDPRVKGRVNFRSVAPVPKEDVLPLMEVILRLNGIGVVEEGGLYRIIPIGDMPREPAPVGIGREPGKITISGLGLLQVVPLKYIASTEIVRVLTPFLSVNAVIVDVPKINYIIIVDTDANVKRLLQLVEIFDSEQLRLIKPQVFVYPVQNSKAKDLTALLQQIYLGGTRTPTSTRPTTTPTPARPPTPGTPTPAPTPSPQPQVSLGSPGTGEALVSEVTRIFADEVSNAVIILATPDDYALILETIKKIDVVPRQVMIEVLIAEITLGDDLKFGLEWSMRTKMGKGFAEFGFNSQNLPITGKGGQDIGFSFLGLDQLGLIRGFLQTLASQSKANVLAAPHILAADNREARIQIGDQVPIKTSDSAISGTTTSTFQYKDTGVILKIKPLINDSGLVYMDLTQEVSDYFLQNIFGEDFPVITKREVTTSLVAQDGQTIVIGGLIREKVGRTREGLPFLSKIPILGYLFGYTADEFKRSEIVLLLTPRVIRNQKEAENVNSIYIHRLDPKTRNQFRLEEMSTLPKKGQNQEPEKTILNPEVKSEGPDKK
jgi:type II secretory pathway component GspD/PulD (secretin)